LLRPYLFKGVNASDPLSTVQYTTIAMVIAHFLKREVETAFIHKFSASTMPFFNVFKNSAHYWFLSGINITYWVCSPSSYAARPLTPTTSLVVYAGLALYVIGELGNLNAHLALSSLRSRGGTERGIPRGLMFDTVTCANYFFEVVSWVGILLVSQSLATLIFLIVAAGQMQVWACTKEKALRRDFPETYKQKRYPMIPGLPGPPPRKTKSSK
jgi:very-long-chain enoyl-CoA reductase